MAGLLSVFRGGLRTVAPAAKHSRCFAAAADTKSAKGAVSQVIGAVVDVSFEG
eukprot:CAMPEP_0197646702 /NCGR_PEP_ID=MMETSP1338-20131121/23804_1 /TAXON_ID=43686 ORGANISM="Pelagodinium beii, Strain RCC1491" /NCGR_SAMPLE_ID=MMETSP1338 /ASSEMBLY_ACC=CAM_ASM_000754 /LENGTH=52 /DNA_ID=CAMNT_0043220357 /DNA_START=52 /DNA_END=207 /DNA_ORIENTATION=-